MSEGGVHWLLVLSMGQRSHEFIAVLAAERLVYPHLPEVLEDSGPPPNAARRSVAQRGEFGLREGGLRLLHGGGHQGGVEEFGTKLERSVRESVQGPTDSVSDEEERVGGSIPRLRSVSEWFSHQSCGVPEASAPFRSGRGRRRRL